MHHKIQKSRKHKKLKAVDPFNFKAQEEQRKIFSDNLPPKSNDQEVPWSFKNRFSQPKRRVESAASSQIPTKKKKREDEFVKLKWENEHQYLSRINRQTSDFVNEQLLKIKYDMIDSDNEREGKNDDKDEDGLSRKEKALLADKNKLRKKASNAKGIPQKKIKKPKKTIDLLNTHERVTFGERVDQPPNLSNVAKKLATKIRDKPSKTGGKNLLLKGLLDEKKSSDIFTPLSTKNHSTDSTIKCGDKSRQDMLIKERNRVIEAYRNSKRQRNV